MSETVGLGALDRRVFAGVSPLTFASSPQALICGPRRRAVSRDVS